MKANELTIGWAMKQSDPVAALQQVIDRVKTWGRRHQEQLECYVGGTIAFALMAGLYILASVLEGGAA